MPKRLDVGTSVLNYIFTVYFVFEVIIRMSGYGLEEYLSEFSNWYVLTSSIGRCAHPATEVCCSAILFDWPPALLIHS